MYLSSSLWRWTFCFCFCFFWINHSTVLYYCRLFLSILLMLSRAVAFVQRCMYSRISVRAWDHVPPFRLRVHHSFDGQAERFISVDSFSPFVGYSVQSCRLVVDISVRVHLRIKLQRGSSPFCHFSLSHFSVFFLCLVFTFKQTDKEWMNANVVLAPLPSWNDPRVRCHWTSIETSSPRQSCVRVSMNRRRRRRLWALLTRLVTMVCTIF